MRIENQNYFYFPINDLVADLKVTDSKGTELVILSDAEFKELKGVDMSKVRSEFFVELHPNLTDYEFIDKFRIVPILFDHESDTKGYYEKIFLSWVDKFENRKKDHISEYVEFPITQPKYGIADGDESSLYLSIKTNDKYEMDSDPEIIDRSTNEKIDHRTILDDERHKTYRFAGNFFTQVIQVTIKIGLPKMIRIWAKLGLTATIVVPIAITIMTILLRDIPQFSFHVIFGTIGFVIGLRAIVFHDVDLMKGWNNTFLLAILWCSIFLFILMFWQQHIDTKIVLHQTTEPLKYLMVHI